MPCSNCTVQEYAEWVARMAEIIDEQATNNNTISTLQQANQVLQQEYGTLKSKKQQCDMQGGPP